MHTLYIRENNYFCIPILTKSQARRCLIARKIYGMLMALPKDIDITEATLTIKIKTEENITVYP